jgi:hypothetical protein
MNHDWKPVGCECTWGQLRRSSPGSSQKKGHACRCWEAALLGRLAFCVAALSEQASKRLGRPIALCAVQEP